MYNFCSIDQSKTGVTLNTCDWRLVFLKRDIVCCFMDSFVSSMVSILVFFSSAMLGCVILHCQIREVTSFPFEFDDVRDSDGTIYKTVPSKRYYT